jgi:hypothetical protein
MSNRLKFTQHFFILLLFGFATGCAYHTRDEAVPVNNTNTCTDSVQYTYMSVEGIFNKQSCTACHGVGGSLPQLSDSTAIKTYVNAQKTKFIQAIRFQGDHPMPKGGPPMPEADMKKIETWICQGMK